MDFWTYVKYGAKKCKVTLNDGTVHCGYLYTQTFDREEGIPKRVVDFCIMNDKYERVLVKVEEVRGIEVVGS